MSSGQLLIIIEYLEVPLPAACFLVRPPFWNKSAPFRISTKFPIFNQISEFQPNFRFSTKFQNFNQISEFQPNFRISTKFLNFNQISEFWQKHRKNCECCHHHSLFKGHNVNVNIVVLNCQKWNQCLKCQVSGHKFLGLLFDSVFQQWLVVSEWVSEWQVNL